MPERPREFDDDGALIDVTYPDEYKELINFTGTLTIEDSVTFPEDSSALFSGYQASQINIFCDTGNVTNMRYMFQKCAGLTKLSLSSFDTSNVTDMQGMFQDCKGPELLDISNFNTSNVTDMSKMFAGAKIDTIDLTGLDASNVTNMSFMFAENEVDTIDLTGLHTSKVTDMSYMFEGSYSLTEIIGFESLNTSNVTKVEYMFWNCKALRTVDMSNFDASEASDPSNMFFCCESLQELDLSNWDTSKISSFQMVMFECKGLKKLNLGGKFTITDECSIDNMFGTKMFDYIEKVEIIVLSKNIKNLAASYIPRAHWDGVVYTGYWVNTDEPYNVIDSLENEYKGDYPGTYIWQKYGSTIIFDSNGGEGTMENQTIGNGVSSTLSDNGFTRTGYTFDGWNTKSDGSGTPYAKDASFEGQEKETLKLYAQWKPYNYTVKFEANDSDATGNMKDQTFTFDKAQKLSDNSYTKKGYTFIGWNTVKNPDVDNPGNFYNDKESVKNLTDENNGTVTLYAQWEKDSYVIFEPNGGTGTMKNQIINFNTIKKLKKNEFTKEGYHFDHWNTKADDSGDSYADMSDFSKTNKEDITLYAQWKANSEPSVEEYTITFEANGGKGTMEKQKIKDGDSDKLNKNEFTKEGYHFDHWNTKANDTGDSYADMSDFSKTDKEDVTLYAQWEKDKVKDPDVKPNPDSNSNSKPDKEKPTDEKKDKENKSGNKNASKNPKTGILASSGLVLLLAASGAYVSSKRK